MRDTLPITTLVWLSSSHLLDKNIRVPSFKTTAVFWQHSIQEYPHFLKPSLIIEYTLFLLEIVDTDKLFMALIVTEEKFLRSTFFFAFGNIFLLVDKLKFYFCPWRSVILSWYSLALIILYHLFWVEVFLSICRFNFIKYSRRVFFYYIIEYFSLFHMFCCIVQRFHSFAGQIFSIWFLHLPTSVKSHYLFFL